MSLARPPPAASLGAFALVSIGAGAATVLAPNGAVASALAHGSVFMTSTCAFGNDGGSSVDPAPTMAALLCRLALQEQPAEPDAARRAAAAGLI